MVCSSVNDLKLKINNYLLNSSLLPAYFDADNYIQCADYHTLSTTSDTQILLQHTNANSRLELHDYSN